MSGVTVEAKGIKEIMQMFDGLPKRVNKDAVWGRFWKKVTVPLLAIKPEGVSDQLRPMLKFQVPVPQSHSKEPAEISKSLFTVISEL